MNGLDERRLLAALMLLAMALFVGAGLPSEARWRLWLRRATVAAFVVALAATLLEIALWWNGLHR